MNDTIKLRELIRGRTDTFIAADFDIDKAALIMNRMRSDGELDVVCYDKSKKGRPIARYKIIKLRPFRVKYRCSEKACVMPLYAQLWAQVYPDLFRIPDFSGYRQTMRRFVGLI